MGFPLKVNVVKTASTEKPVALTVTLVGTPLASGLKLTFTLELDRPRTTGEAPAAGVGDP